MPRHDSDQALQHSPKTNPPKAQRWPIKALAVLEAATDAFSCNIVKATSMSKQCEAISGLSALGKDTVRKQQAVVLEAAAELMRSKDPAAVALGLRLAQAGDAEMAITILDDIRTAANVAMMTAAQVHVTSGDGKMALVGARVGEYSNGDK
jgi:hypothetical protein